MTVTSPPPLTHTGVSTWTPRQREVLDLLVKGCTNREIAERLGISLDGAKWHVSEIITRLGVESRDEAAEYWRHQNGLRMRFMRMASFVTSTTMKWAAGAAAVVVVVAVSAMVIFALHESGDEGTEHGGSGVETPGTTVATPSPGTTATPTAPPPIRTVPNPTGKVIAGVQVSGFVFGTPGSLPVPLSVIVEKGCYQCDGPSSAFERVTLDASGKLKVEELYKPTNGYILGSYWDPAGREHYLSICSRGYCGGVGQVTADAQTTVLRSTDGGVRWQAMGTFDGGVTVAAKTSQGALLNRSTYAIGAFDYRFQLLGTEQVIRPPAGAEPEYTSSNQLIGWRLADGKTVQGLDGGTLVVLPDVGVTDISVESVLADGTVVISWHDGTPPLFYLGLIQGGQLVRVYEAPPYLAVGSVLTQAIAFGNGTLPGAGDAPLYPLLIDFGEAKVNVLELFGPVGSDAYQGQRNRIRLVEPGPFLRVTGAGSCLNVREEPSPGAKVLGCFADTVLLRDRSDERVANGVTWHKVETPSGATGWASKEFLAR